MNKPHTEETKNKIRQSRLGQKLSPSHRRKVIRTLSHGKESENPNWKGGRSLKQGYVTIRVNGKYVLEHRHIIEQELKRKLSRGEHVHHLNGDRQDNRRENLILLSRGAHTKEHWTDEKKEKYSSYMSQYRKEHFWSTKKQHN